LLFFALKGHDFSRAVKTLKMTRASAPEGRFFRREAGVSISTEFALKCFVSRHDFTARGKHFVLKGHDFTACEKMQMVEQEASGHDFSRAEQAQMMRALAPEVCWVLGSTNLQIVPTSCLSLPTRKDILNEAKFLRAQIGKRVVAWS
jgi:hypothetical protein